MERFHEAGLANEQVLAVLSANAGVSEGLMSVGKFHFWCVRDGRIVWEDECPNTVMTLGKNLLLDLGLAGGTATGPFMGLISDDSWSAISAADTMSSHAGWHEAGSTYTPHFTARITTNGGWNAAAAGAKALTSALAFTMTAGGTLKGAFLVAGSGAVATLMNTSGTLFSAALFTGGDRVVQTSDVVNASYSLSV